MTCALRTKKIEGFARQALRRVQAIKQKQNNCFGNKSSREETKKPENLRSAQGRSTFG
jgi:hypothetical protein